MGEMAEGTTLDATVVIFLPPVADGAAAYDGFVRLVLGEGRGRDVVGGGVEEGSASCLALLPAR